MTNEQLVLRIQRHDDVAVNMLQLYEQMKPFIRSLTRKYQGRGRAEMDDLEQESYLALYDAVDNYNADAGCSFAHYAALWIKQRIIRYVQGSAPFKIPALLSVKLYQMQEYEKAYAAEYGRSPSELEIRDFLQLSDKMFRKLLEVAEMAKIVSIDTPITEDQSMTLGDELPSGVDLEEEVIAGQLPVILWGLVDDLPGDLPDVVRCRYQDGNTAVETGERLGMRPNVVRRMEAKALRELRKPEPAVQLLPYLPEAEKIYERAIHGNSVGQFERTWTSSTERVAMRL